MILPLSFKTDSSVNPALYLCKLAQLHGYQDVRIMLKAYRLRLPQGQQNHLIGYSSIVKALTGQDIDYAAPAEFQYDSTRYFKSLVSNHLKVCPDCLECGSSPIEHNLVTSATCRVHSLKLLAECPQCNHELTFDRQLLTGSCSYCGHCLPRVSQNEPEYQKMLYDLRSDKRLDAIHDLALAAGYILRPYDCIPAQIKNEEISDWIGLFSKAFKLLTDKETLLNWGSEVFKQKQTRVKGLGVQASLAGIVFLDEHTMLDWPELKNARDYFSNTLTFKDGIFSGEKLLSEMPEETFVSKRGRHLKALNEEDIKSYFNYRITLEGLSMVSGIDLEVLEALYKNNTFKTIGAANNYSQNFVDLRDVSRIVTEVSEEVETFTHVLPDSMNLLIEKLMLVNLSMSQFWHFAFSHSNLVRIGEGSEKIIDRAYIDKPALMKFCFKTFTADTNGKLRKSVVMDIFGLSEFDLRELAKHDLLHPMPWNQRHTYYRIKHLINMENKLFCLGRYCELRGLDFQTTASQLESVGIHPVLGRSIFECRYQVLHFLKFNQWIEPKKRYLPPSNFTFLKGRDPRKALLLN
ncbi:hypothetical protein [Neptunicella sp. SCSIO 80796]|uniref:hypothetical protein n=1 Tax=Neptunicella plasticusilytica TaxID=3117012 RepID=UPI003A4D20CF